MKLPTRDQIAVLPTLAEALYEPPTPPAENAKSCGNCGLWSLDERCVLFGDKAIFSWDVCSYHVAGTPMPRKVHLKVLPLDPTLAGLSWAPKGTKCGSCEAFIRERRLCTRTRDDKVVKLATVHQNGCCSRYTGWAVPV